MGQDSKLTQLDLSMKNRQTWIGWIIIAGLFTLVMFFMGGWIRTTEVEIRRLDNESKRIELELTTTKGRIEAQGLQVATLLAVLNRIEEFMRTTDNRLTRMEISSERERISK